MRKFNAKEWVPTLYASPAGTREAEGVSVGVPGLAAIPVAFARDYVAAPVYVGRDATEERAGYVRIWGLTHTRSGYKLEAGGSFASVRRAARIYAKFANWKQDADAAIAQAQRIGLTSTVRTRIILESGVFYPSRNPVECGERTAVLLNDTPTPEATNDQQA